MRVGELRKAHDEAVNEGKEEFEIQGYKFLTKYAYYVLEYLKSEGLSDMDEFTLTKT